jgi:integrase
VDGGVTLARASHRLTTLRVAREKRSGLHADGGGLYLRITKSGSKNWVFRYTLRGQPRWMGLGPADLYGLAEAREKAVDARRQRHEGVDPIDARRATRARERVDSAKALTFKQGAEAYIKAHRSGWRNEKHADQWASTLATYAYPIIGSLPIQDIDTTLVMRVLEQDVAVQNESRSLWAAKPETAGRLRGRIETILDWARVRGHRAGENPARWRGHLDKLLPARSKVRQVKHHAALPYADLPAFMAELRICEGVAARALEFVILNAVRTGDIIGSNRDDSPPMRIDHLDLPSRVWTIPKTKNNSEHRVPLSDASVDLLGALSHRTAGSIVFPGMKSAEPLSNGSMLRVLDRMGRGELTVHGFRATFKTWASERTNFPREVVEAALAHTISDKLEAAYRRGDFFEKRRRLMSAWAEYCTNVPVKKGDIVALRIGQPVS